MKRFLGTYLGFGPTDESAIRAGELEVTITEETIKFRLATGLKVQEYEFPTADMRQLTNREISVYIEDPLEAGKFTVFQKNNNGLQFIFTSIINEDPTACGLTIFRGDIIDEFFGPSGLYTPAQVAEGRYTDLLAELEAEHGSVFPRLHLEGRAPSR